MNIILLSGGSGQRLWPLSNNVRSKQFIKVLQGEDGQLESMVQYLPLSWAISWRRPMNCWISKIMRTSISTIGNKRKSVLTMLW